MNRDGMNIFRPSILNISCQTVAPCCFFLSRQPSSGSKSPSRMSFEQMIFCNSLVLIFKGQLFPLSVVSRVKRYQCVCVKSVHILMLDTLIRITGGFWTSYCCTPAVIIILRKLSSRHAQGGGEKVRSETES